MPVGVFAFDQVDLPLPVPVLKLLLAADGGFHVAEQFVSHQRMDAMSAGETFDFSVPMLPQPWDEFACDAYVESAVWLAGEYVDAGLAFELHVFEIDVKWMLKQVQHDV